MAQEVPRWPQRGSKRPPRTPKMAQRGPKMVPRALNMTAKVPKMAPKEPKMAPRWPQEASKGAKMDAKIELSMLFWHLENVEISLVFPMKNRSQRTRDKP